MSQNGPNGNSENTEDARDLCRSLLQSNPQMPYKEVRLGAENLGLKISRWMYSAVQRELAGTVGGKDKARSDSQKNDEGPDASTAASAGTEGGAQESSEEQAPEPIKLKEVGKLKSPVMAFTVNFLRERPTAPFKDVRAAAESAGITLYPISYGRAQALLGIVKAKPRRSAAQRRADSFGAGEGKSKRRSLVQGALYPSTEVEGFLDTAHALAAERDHYRKALESLRRVLRKALNKPE